jgi:CheY-like chemotaxis protein
MVFGMAQRHDAEVAIESTPGVGTTLRLTFPVLAGTAAESAQATVAVKALPPLHILVVDDDPLLSRSLRETLESDGHTVTTAPGGREGIDIFRAAEDRNEPFALVITDLGMPFVDGRKVACAVKSACPSAPVIMLTGWGQRLIADEDVPAHVDRLLNKPPKLRELRTAMIEVMTSSATATPA